VRQINKIENIVAAVAKLVNCIRSKGLNHHQFEQYFFSDMDSESGNILYLMLVELKVNA
jgi:hypothetical protein